MFGAMPLSRYAFGTIPWYSLTMVTGIAVAIWLASREEKRLGLPKDTVVDLAFWAIPLGIIGARLYYVAFEWDQFAPDPIKILYIWQGGIAIYGAVIGGLAACYLFSRRRKLSMLTLVDMIVPGLALAQAIGRWGNYFNMEAYGEAVTNPSLQFFPFAVQILERGAPVWHLATFFYESVWDLGVFGILTGIRKKLYRAGDATLWYLMLYGSGRAFIEGLRMDSLMAAGGGVRVSQWLSVGMCFLGACVFLIRDLRVRSQKAPGLLGIAFCLAAVAQLYLGFSSAVPSWVPLAVFGVMAALVLIMGWLAGKDGLARLIPAACVLLCYLAVLFLGSMDPLLSRTLKIMLLALLFPLVAFYYYPYSKPAKEAFKEDSPCET